MNRAGYREYSDSTLIKLTKRKIIDLLRVAEHNFFVTDEALDNSARAGQKIASEAYAKGYHDAKEAMTVIYGLKDSDKEQFKIPNLTKEKFRIPESKGTYGYSIEPEQNEDGETK